MFGMLDYRAHRLLWIFLLPITILGLLLSYSGVIIAVILARDRYGEGIDLLWQFGFAFLVAEIIALATLILLTPLKWALGKLFHFFIEVMPAEGRDAATAEAILQSGDMGRYLWKMHQNPDGFDERDRSALLQIVYRSNGFLIRAIRLIFGTGPGRAFPATPEQRISVMLELAKENKGQRSFVDFVMHADEVMRARQLYPTSMESLFSAHRHMIYRLTFFVMFFWAFQS